MDPDAILREYGRNMEALASVRKLARWATLALFSLLILGSVVLGARWLLGALPSPWGSLAVVGVVALSILVFQAVGSLLISSWGHSVDWAHASKESLRGVVSHERLGGYAGWDVQALWSQSSGQAPAALGGEEPGADGAAADACTANGRTVILLHGFLSDSTRSWGLLPAMVARMPEVRCVVLLSYKHTLWSSRRRLDEVTGALAMHLEQFGEGRRQRVVLFAHSLGGLFALRAIHELHERNRSALAFVDRVVCVASPLIGSMAAWAGLPWAWPLALRIGSSFVSTTIRQYVRVFPPAGHLVGEDDTLPAVSFIHGESDRLAGILSQLIDLPGSTSVPAEHSSINQVYNDEYVASIYRN